MKTAAIIALAGLATVASAQSATMVLSHDDVDGIINVGESVTWTLSVAFTGGDAASGGNQVISGDNALGNSSAMAYTPTNGGSNGGSSNGAGIGFVNWTNSLFLEAFGSPADHSNPFVVGSFSFTASAVGVLNYSFARGTVGGGQADSAFVSIAQTAFAETLFDTESTAGVSYDIQSLTIVPSPASAALLGLGGLVAVRRRR
ncbi:MAG: hypothetical protein ACI89L_002752 [Phycisphaerales bacterium]|jgi:hypothetical protein